MQMPWLIAALALVPNPDKKALPTGAHPPHGPTLNNAVQQQRETRGYGLTIDHEQKQIVVRAWFFAARNHPREREQLAAILKFWKRQNQRFIYRLGRGQEAIDYRIEFELRQAPGTHGPGGFFLPSPEVPTSLLNQIEVVPRQDMDRLRPSTPQSRMAGYAPNNFIYIAEDVSQQTWIGVHEAGHRIGLSHEAQGLMNPQLDHLSRRVSRRAIRQILAGGHIIGRTHHARRLARYPVEAAQVEVVGQAPRDFYVGGKVKRR